MKLRHSLVALAALSTLSFAGGDINPVTVFEQEPVIVPIEPIAPPPPLPPIEPLPLPTPEPLPLPTPEPLPLPTPEPTPEPTPIPTPMPTATPKPLPTPTPKPLVEAKPLGIYIAGGVTDVTASSAHADMPSFFKDERNQDIQIGFTGRLGYDFMDYLGAELRGTYGFAKVDNGYRKYKQLGAYLKPNYDVMENLNLYGLIGASKSNHSGIARSTTGLSYGAGLNYGLGNNISIFTDVINYMDKSNVPESWGLTLGAGYQF